MEWTSCAGDWTKHTIAAASGRIAFLIGFGTICLQKLEKQYVCGGAGGPLLPGAGSFPLECLNVIQAKVIAQDANSVSSHTARAIGVSFVRPNSTLITIRTLDVINREFVNRQFGCLQTQAERC